MVQKRHRLFCRDVAVSREKLEPLFVYGTLLPLDLSTEGRDWTPWIVDEVQGRLYDLGPYPGLIDLDDPQAGWVRGCIRFATRTDLETILDDYEGVDEGLFQRVRTITRNGIPSWIYVYCRPIEEGVRGPLESWDGRRGIWPSEEFPETRR